MIISDSLVWVVSGVYPPCNPHHDQVIAGWEEGFTGQCAGERITMVVPPSLGYGNQASDKVTLMMLMTILIMVMILMKTLRPGSSQLNPLLPHHPGWDCQGDQGWLASSLIHHAKT